MTTNVHIRVRDLNVHYHRVHSLKGVNLDIPGRQITAIVGPSGCGKSTLLRSFNRMLDELDGARVSGQVWIDGMDVYAPGVDVTLVRKRVGLLSQRPSPLPMSIYENVAYGPRVHGERRRAELDRIVETYLRMAGLWDEVKDRLAQPATRLSMGQQQRLCLARGLAVEPEVILADEATSALDPQSSRHVEEQFLKLKDRYTIVMVTHILRQARRLADYVVFVYLGEVVEHGPALQMFEDPQKEMTKEYMKGVIS